MYLRNRLFFACLFFLVSMFAAKAQTLYWVGGSGNFNDPQHWSTVRGGLAPGNLSPTKFSTVVFSDQNAGNNYSVFFGNGGQVAAVKIETSEALRFKKTGNLGSLTVFGDFIVDIKGNLVSSEIDLSFEGSAVTEHIISTSQMLLEGDAKINDGNWRVQNLLLSNTALLDIADAKVNFDYAFVSAGSIKVNTSKKMQSTASRFVVANKFE